ncbi:MAG: ABC transporter permease [Candidatus Falkowbacteria bacterium]
MNIEIIKMAFEALLGNKLRAALSMLGIIIGVTTVIAVFAVGQGAQNAVNDQFQNLSANSIIVMGMFGRGATQSSKLTTADARAIMEKSEHVKSAAGSIMGNLSASYGSESGSYSIIGADANYFSISNLKLGSGRFFEEADVQSKAMAAVIGSDVVTALWPDGENPVGTTITVGGKRLEVIGTIEEVGSNIGRMSPDEAIVVPDTTAQKSLLGDRGQVMINAQSDTVDNIKIATEEITAILRSEHNLKVGAEDDFRIMDAGSMIGAAQSAATLMTVLLTAIAAITLLVSGIGIMNVMFVTVAERTKEIGIAKAIGGKRADILGQFLFESVAMSMIGGLIGIILGHGIIYLVNQVESLSSIITLAPSVLGVSIGFGFSVLVGVTFGFYPALKASRLDPVDALRSE